ncbi:hypothetical protein [Altererythrobacter epoxidivorans]|uniref:hypothetical protein n=1 Tax=Altererythrobacter epoxidivorans TaxID=361183 RepID=UPI0030844048
MAKQIGQALLAPGRMPFVLLAQLAVLRPVPELQKRTFFDVAELAPVREEVLDLGAAQPNIAPPPVFLDSDNLAFATVLADNKPEAVTVTIAPRLPCRLHRRCC